MYDGVGDGGRVEDPAPAGVLGDEPAGYRAYGGTEKGSKTVDGDGFASFFRSEAVT